MGAINKELATPFFITSFLNNGKIKSIIDNKDIISYLLIGSISQVINLHISITLDEIAVNVSSINLNDFIP